MLRSHLNTIVTIKATRKVGIITDEVGGLTGLQLEGIIHPYMRIFQIWIAASMLEAIPRPRSLIKQVGSMSAQMLLTSLIETANEESILAPGVAVSASVVLPAPTVRKLLRTVSLLPSVSLKKIPSLKPPNSSSPLYSLWNQSWKLRPQLIIWETRN